MVLAVVLYTALLAVLPVVLDHSTFKWTFSEAGPFEQLSIVGWLFASAIVLIRARPFGRTGAAFALLFALLAAREADWHKAFTVDSILKINYYKHAAAPLEQKVLAAIVAAVVILLIIYVGVLILRFLFLEQGWRTRAGIWLFLASVLVVIGKMLDRGPAVLAEDYGITLSPMVDLYTTAFEEGYEMMHPLLMAWAAWLGQRDGLYGRPMR